MLVFFALGNTKVLSFVLADAKVSNTSSFASQWNIGLILIKHCINGLEWNKCPTELLLLSSKRRKGMEVAINHEK